MRILVVQDEERLARMLAGTLERHGYAADMLASGAEARSRLSLRGSDYDAAVLDDLLPAASGASIAKELRERGSALPILMLMGRPEREARAALLLAGADDCLVKPFSSEEFLVRLRALLRRPASSTLSLGALELDAASRVARHSGETLTLTPKEFDLLAYFMRRPDEAVSREELFAQLWDPEEDASSNVVDVHVMNLRRKLGRDRRTSPLAAVRGVGYRLRGSPAP